MVDKMKAGLAVICGVGAIATAGVAVSHNVPLRVTRADARAVKQLSKGTLATVPNPWPSFTEQVAIILAVQDAVLKAAPTNKGIPTGHSRELGDLLRLRYGLCYDRSRAIETVLRYRGFEVRHVAIYRTVEAASPLIALISPGTESHAVTEVHTLRGWMLVDSNSRWVGLTTKGDPISISELRRSKNVSWHVVNKGPPAPIFQEPFTWMYGLYSRHGHFFRPYDVVPDVNWSELSQNL